MRPNRSIYEQVRKERKRLRLLKRTEIDREEFDLERQLFDANEARIINKENGF